MPVKPEDQKKPPDRESETKEAAGAARVSRKQFVKSLTAGGLAFFTLLSTGGLAGRAHAQENPCDLDPMNDNCMVVNGQEMNDVCSPQDFQTGDLCTVSEGSETGDSCAGTPTQEMGDLCGTGAPGGPDVGDQCVADQGGSKQEAGDQCFTSGNGSKESGDQCTIDSKSQEVGDQCKVEKGKETGDNCILLGGKEVGDECSVTSPPDHDICFPEDLASDVENGPR